uniref:Uncharacterized protein n=1 Tax=Rhizophora mucronata TaxID=61149 RepID=A0A2P2JBJ9_RHIMU
MARRLCSRFSSLSSVFKVPKPQVPPPRLDILSNARNNIYSGFFPHFQG